LKYIYWLTACGGILKWFIFTPDTRWLLIIDAMFCTAIWTSMTMLIPSMLADLCDEDELEHNKRREGLFVSVHTWVVNISMAFAVLFAGLALNLIGFDALKQGLQSSESITSLRIILSMGTVLFSLLPLLFIRYYRIDEKRSIATRQKLHNRTVQNQLKKIQQEQNI
jgi:glycoside/pentoside/hexuronide:cation symporter, GPH family